MGDINDEYSLENVDTIVAQFGPEPWPRPPGVEYPKVWIRFEGRPQADGSRQRFKIQDMTEDYFPEVFKWQTEFTKEERTNHLLGVNTGKVRERNLISRLKWTLMMMQKVSVICLTDNDNEPPELAGFNVNEVVTPESFEMSKAIVKQGFKIPEADCQAEMIMDMKDKANIFERYNTKVYMDALGLFVLPQFRKNGIGEKLLLARIPMCKMLGISVTVNTFSSEAVRRVASKVGFKYLDQITMADIGKKIGKQLPEDECVQLMLLAIE